MSLCNNAVTSLTTRGQQWSKYTSPTTFILYQHNTVVAHYQVAMNWAYISSPLALSWFNGHQIISKIRKNQSAIIKSWNITIHLVSDKPVKFVTEGFQKTNDSLPNEALFYKLWCNAVIVIIIYGICCENSFLKLYFFKSIRKAVSVIWSRNLYIRHTLKLVPLTGRWCRKKG